MLDFLQQNYLDQSVFQDCCRFIN